MMVDNENSIKSCVIHPRMPASVFDFFLRMKVVYHLNCVVARNACWFTMAMMSDGIDSQMMLHIIVSQKEVKYEVITALPKTIEK